MCFNLIKSVGSVSHVTECSEAPSTRYVTSSSGNKYHIFISKCDSGNGKVTAYELRAEHYAINHKLLSGLLSV